MNRWNIVLCATVFFAALAFFAPADVSAVAERELPQSREQISLSFAPLVKKIVPAVVSVSSTRIVAAPSFRHPFLDDPFFAPFFGNGFPGAGNGLSRKRVENALGSGVIVREDGLVVTNSHVIRGADEIKVTLSDGNEFPVDIVIDDQPSDLALLQIRAEGAKFPFAPVKSSEAVEVGDLVIAIGNPFGVGQTVTSGIVSALARPNLNINDYNFFIQTDAAINPGNSGGPLVSMDGGVIGINTAIYSRSGGSLGIGFAIPSEMVSVILSAEKSGQTGSKGIARAWLGLTGQQVDSDIGESLGLEKPSGVLVASMHSESPARKAGIRQGDVIIAIGGREVRDAAEMKFRWAQVPIGEEAAFTILRDGKTRDIKVKADLPPDFPPRNETKLEGSHALSGATVASVNPAVAFELELDENDEGGVVVTEVKKGSPASRLVSPGDILVSVNGNKIDDAAQVEKILKSGEYQIDLIIDSHGQVRRIVMR